MLSSTANTADDPSHRSEGDMGMRHSMALDMGGTGNELRECGGAACVVLWCGLMLCRVVCVCVGVGVCGRQGGRGAFPA